MQSQVREISTNTDSSVVKLVAMFCLEGCFGIKKPQHFFSFKNMSILQITVLLFKDSSVFQFKVVLLTV